MFLKVNNSDFNFLGFVLGILCTLLFGLNAVMAYSQFAGIYFTAFALLSIVLIFSNFLGDIKPALILFFILGFPEYGANPYEINYFSPFYIQKYVIILLCMTMFSLKIKKYVLLFIISLFFSWLLSFYYGVNGAVLNEIVHLFILICLLNMKIYESNQKLIMTFLLTFISFCFIASIIIDFFGLYSLRGNGGTAYFYGHWFGILAGYFIIFIGRARYSFKFKAMLSAFFCFSLYMNLSSLQSSHLIFIVLCLFIGFRIFEKINVRSAGLSVLFCCFLYFFVSNVTALGSVTGEYAWLYMKGLQVLSLTQLEVTALNNSPLIRFNEILSLFQQSNPLQLFIGRGFASTYELRGAYWELTNLHSATFPLSQIESGDLQMVHETLTSVFKWSGLAGILVIYLILTRTLRWEGLDDTKFYFILTLVAIFLLSSVHTGLLCLMLIRYIRGIENKNELIKNSS